MARPDTQERPGRKECTIFVRAQLHFTHFVQLFIELQVIPPKFVVEM